MRRWQVPEAITQHRDPAHLPCTGIKATGAVLSAHMKSCFVELRVSLAWSYSEA